MRLRPSGSGLRVSCTSSSSRTIEQSLRAANIFALPSVREAMPMALLEAMSSGLPAVASRMPGATDAIIEDGRNGILVTPGDSEGLASAIRAPSRRPSPCGGPGAPRRANHRVALSVEQAARDWLAAYQRVMNES